MYWLKLYWNLLRAWWTNSIYVRVYDSDVFIQTYPTIRCHCGKPTIKRDTGDIFQYRCAYGCCGYSKYERK